METKIFSISTFLIYSFSLSVRVPGLYGSLIASYNFYFVCCIQQIPRSPTLRVEFFITGILVNRKML
jgi:hypothetical protein